MKDNYLMTQTLGISLEVWDDTIQSPLQLNITPRQILHT